ncbi:MAG: L-threonylcarbamoyladenylate synthase [Nitrospinales bacterium]
MAKIIKINFSQPQDSQIHLKEIAEVLNAGGVIGFPTDTFYGLGVDPFNAGAVKEIFNIKNRPADKPLLVLISSLKQLRTLVRDISPTAKQLIDAFWPGPLTILFPSASHLPENITAGPGKIGVRLPSNEFTRRLIESLGHPLTAPSANFSGEKNPTIAAEVARTFTSKISLVVDGGETLGGKESTIVDATVSPPTLIREGAISKERIDEILECP